MKTLRRALVVVALVAASLGATAPPSQAAGGVWCGFTVKIDINPGLSPAAPLTGSWRLESLAVLCWGSTGILVPLGQMTGSGTYAGTLENGNFAGNYSIPGACGGRVNGDWAGSAVKGTASCTGQNPLLAPDECHIGGTIMATANTGNPLLVTTIYVQGSIACAFN